MGSWARKTLSTFRANLLSISDPRLAEYFRYGGANDSGEVVSEGSALGISAVWRAISLISQTLAQLPMRTIRETAPGQYMRTASFIDNPGGPDGPTPFEWRETVFAHLLLHGNAYLFHVFGGAGQLVALVPLHPLCVYIELPSPSDEVQPKGGKWFVVHLLNGERERYDASSLTHVPAMSMDGVYGMSVLQVARNSLGTAIAGDRAAAKMFGHGLTIAGLITPDEDEPDWDDASFIKDQVNDALTGNENMGKIAVLPRKLKFQQMEMSAEDAQFLQSRQFSIEEIARWFGVPPFELMQTDKQTSWGTGIEAQQRGLGRTVLAPWASRLEQRLSRLLPNPRFVEIDFAGLERPSPDVEIRLLLEQIEGGLITINEARAVRNLPPVPGGNILRVHGVALDAAVLAPTETESADAAQAA